jgi:hypothetical protein
MPKRRGLLNHPGPFGSHVSPVSHAGEYAAQTIRSVLPMMEKLGVATAEEVRVETLAERLRDEVVAGGGVIVFANLVGAWARKPH